jgi:hypothetical protein
LAIVKVEKEVKCLGSWDQGNGFVMVDLWNSEESQLKGGGEEETNINYLKTNQLNTSWNCMFFSSFFVFHFYCCILQASPCFLFFWFGFECFQVMSCVRFRLQHGYHNFLATTFQLILIPINLPLHIASF